MSGSNHNDSELRWRLRQLPREREPQRDLWPELAARLAHAPQSASRVPAPSRRPRAALATISLAAGLALAVGLAWLWTGAPSRPPEQLVSAATLRQADALAVEYESALAQFAGAPIPTTVQPALQELDRSAEQIRLALAADPRSRFLLDQLRRTYERRLDLLQHGLLG